MVMAGTDLVCRLTSLMELGKQACKSACQTQQFSAFTLQSEGQSCLQSAARLPVLCVERWLNCGRQSCQTSLTELSLRQ